MISRLFDKSHAWKIISILGNSVSSLFFSITNNTACDDIGTQKTDLCIRVPTIKD